MQSLARAQCGSQLGATHAQRRCGAAVVAARVAAVDRRSSSGGSVSALAAPSRRRCAAAVARAASPLTSAEQQLESSTSASASNGAEAAALAQQQQQDQQQQQRVLTGRVARFRATKRATRAVVERGQRSLAEYMALPASQYSVLDARKVERVDDATFRCYVGELAFLGFRVEPVITVSVEAGARGCTIRLLSCELQGSPAAVEANERFTARMTNVVTWAAAASAAGAAAAGAAAAAAGDAAVVAGEQAAAAAGKSISSDTTIEVAVEVPRWLPLPVASVEAAGSGVMAATLAAMVPRFLAQLDADYGRWAAGDASRRPLGEGVL